MNRINLSLNIRNSLPIIIVICFLIIFIFSAVVLYPRYQNFQEVQRNIKEKKEEVAIQEDYFSKLSQIKTELEKYKEELSKINSALPDSPFLPSIFSFLQKASSQSGLVLKGISPFIISSPEESPNIKEIQFGLEVVGPYQSFKNFLSTLEKSARLIEVDNISFAAPKGETPAGQENLFTFNLRIKVYSY